MSRPRALTLEQIKTLRAEYVAGAHVDALAHRYGIGRSTVYAYIGVGVRTDAERARDERNARMRAARAAGATYTEIAAAHGLSRQAVQQLLTALPPAASLRALSHLAPRHRSTPVAGRAT